MLFGVVWICFEFVFCGDLGVITAAVLASATHVGPSRCHSFRPCLALPCPLLRGRAVHLCVSFCRHPNPKSQQRLQGRAPSFQLRSETIQLRSTYQKLFGPAQAVPGPIAPSLGGGSDWGKKLCQTQWGQTSQRFWAEVCQFASGGLGPSPCQYPRFWLPLAEPLT